jgi:hypothetical protein
MLYRSGGNTLFLYLHSMKMVWQFSSSYLPNIQDRYIVFRLMND